MGLRRWVMACAMAWAALLGVWVMPSGHAIAQEASERPARVEVERGETARYVFEWQPGLHGYANELMAKVEGYHDRIYGELGIDSEKPTTVVILRDEAVMLDEATARFGGRPPEWAAGLAWPAHRTILLHVGVGPTELDSTFRHEISHIALGEIAVGRRVPRWFSEGLAIRQSEGVDFERAWKLTEAATMGVLHDLDDLNRGFPASGARAGVAYAQAVHFVGYLQGTYGQAAFHRLIAGLRDGLDFEEAMARAYPQPLAAIEADWLSTLKVRWGWLPVLFGSGTLWVFATIVLVLGWRRRRRQKAARIERMQKQEAVEMADDIEVVLPPPPVARSLHDPYDGRPPTIH